MVVVLSTGHLKTMRLGGTMGAFGAGAARSAPGVKKGPLLPELALDGME
jgi:hypothetical protein